MLEILHSYCSCINDEHWTLTRLRRAYASICVNMLHSAFSVQHYFMSILNIHCTCRHKWGQGGGVSSTLHHLPDICHMTRMHHNRHNTT